MAPKKRRNDEGEEEEKKPVIVKRELMVTRSSTRRLNGNSATDSLSSPKPKSKPRTKKAKTSAKEDLKEQKVQVETAEVKAVADDSSKTIVIEHCLMASTRSGSRTPSGKGKGPKPYHKANWDWENTRIYLELVVKEIDAGNRPHMSINPNGYRSLAKTFQAATGLTHSMKQLKNKYNQLKAEWRAWSKLMDSRKGPTGIGFDQETGLINASDEWWATMEKVDKECCKFRTKTLDHEELMRRVFTGAAATGKNAWTPGEMRNQLEVEGESDSADFSTDSNELGASETANLMKSANITASGSGSKRRHSSVTAVQKKRITGAEALATSMDDLVNSVKIQSKEFTVNHVVGGQSVTMAEAVGRLYQIQGLEQTNPLLHFGISLMEVPNNREMVMSIPSDEGIIGWLQVKQQDKERTTAVPTLASILRNQGLRF